MADYAERVVTELIADTSGYDPKIRTSAQLTDRSMSEIERSATRAEAVVRTSATGMGRSMELASQRTRLLGYQISDVGTQLAAGTSPFLILAQQAPQVANALDGTRGVAGRLATFFSGPWGAAMLAAGSVLGVLATRHSEADERAQRHRTAEETVTAALRGETVATNELLEATRQLREQEDKALESQTERIDGLHREAQATLDLANQRRAALVALLQTARETAATTMASLQSQVRYSAHDAADPAIAGQANAAAEEVARLDAEIAAQTRLIQESAGRLANAATDMARQTATHQGRTEADFDRRRRELEEAYRGRRIVSRETVDGRVVTHTRVQGGSLNRPNLTVERRAALEAELTRKEHDLNLERERAIANAQRLDQAETGINRERERTLVRPATGAVLSQFGADRSGVPIDGRRRAGRRHEGVDIRGNVGDAVVAPEGGVATIRNAPGGLGLYVEIRADSGARNLLAHLSSASIRSGQRVEAGQLVGLIGTSGNAAGGTPHVHWQRQVNGQWVDPMRSVGSSGAAQAAQEAQALQERRVRDEAHFQDQLAALNVDLLNARRRQVQTEEEAAADDIAAIEAERDRKNQQFRDEAAARAQRDATQTAIANAEAEQLVAANNQVAEERKRARLALSQERIEEQRIDIAERDLRDQASVLQARGALARTAMERRDIELRLLDLAHQEEILGIQKQRLQQDLTKAQRRQLDEAERRANERYALGQQSVLRQTAGPMESFLDGIPQTAAEMNEALQEVAADGLQALNDGLAQAASRFLHLGGIAGAVLDRIIADLIQIALRQAELAAFGGEKGGGGGFGGFLSSLGSMFGGGGGGGMNSSINALVAGNYAKLPGFASGYVGPVGGIGGTDNNILSINGRARARVSADETLAIIPQGKALGFSGGAAAMRPHVTQVVQELRLDLTNAVLTPELLAEMNAMAHTAAATGAANGAAFVTRRAAQRARQTL